MAYFRIVLLVACIHAAFVSVVGATDVLALNTSNTPPYANEQGSGFQDLLAKEAFGRIGISVSFHHVQTERALLNVDSGIDDGNLIRVSGLTQLYPNIRRIPEELFEYDFVVFAREGLFEPAGWSSLKPFRIAFIRGWKILEQNITEARSITIVANETDLFELLRSGAVDAVVYERWRGHYMLRTLDLKGFRALDPPLTSREMFIYLHKRHSALIPKVAAALRSMKQDGTYAKISKRALGPYILE
jgi:polar amino acid transport system substrate-binding protein